MDFAIIIYNSEEFCEKRRYDITANRHIFRDLSLSQESVIPDHVVDHLGFNIYNKLGWGS